MKKWWFALFVASAISTGSVFAQSEETATDACGANALITTFADAVSENAIREWLVDTRRADCDTVVLDAALDLVSVYGRLNGTTADSGFIAQWASSAEASSQYGDDSWSAMQATGAPNVAQCTDSSSAWASADATEVAELTVSFETPVDAVAIRIHQTYTPGSITQVALVDAARGSVVPIPNSADVPELEPCPRVFTVFVPDNLDIGQVNGVVITVDQSIGGGWNEIDAVELIGFAPES